MSVHLPVDFKSPKIRRTKELVDKADVSVDVINKSVGHNSFLEIVVKCLKQLGTRIPRTALIFIQFFIDICIERLYNYPVSDENSLKTLFKYENSI